MYGGYHPMGPMGMMPPGPGGFGARGPGVLPMGAPAMITVNVTLWVGKIAPGINDDTMRRVLQACCAADAQELSLSVTWRRQLDVRRGVPMQFGFADFRNLEDAWRAMRILQALRLGDRELQLKADEKNQKMLDDHAARKRASAQVAPANGAVAVPVADEYEPDEATLQAPVPTMDQEILSRIEAEEKKGDTAALEAIVPIQEEVNKMYLDMMNQDLDKVTDTEMVKAIRAFRTQKAKEEEDSRKLQEERQREQHAKQQRIRDDKDRARRALDREEKEFSHRLREWEDHERAREAEFERRAQLERQRLPERQRDLQIDEQDEKSNRRRIRARDRRRDRLKEYEADERERRAEEQLEIDRRRAEAEKQRQLEREREEERREREVPVEEVQHVLPAEAGPVAAPSQPAGPVKVSLAPAPKPRTGPASGSAAPSALFDLEDEQAASLEASRRKRNFQQFSDADAEKYTTYNPEEPEEPSTKRPKTEPMDEKSLIERIPTDKQELFRYPVQWNVVSEHKLVDTKLRPWISKKIIEYLGEEEATLVNFVCTKISERERPTELIQQLSVVLEGEAEVFVVKLYRLLLIEMIRAQTR